MKRLIFLFLLASGLQAQELEEVHGLAVGKNAPLLELIDQEGQVLDLKSLVKEQSLLLVFYRGAWCPYCNKHLSELNEIAGDIEKAGVKLIAVSPEKPEKLKEMAAKTEALFEFAWDKDYRLAKAFDLAFLPSRLDRFKYNTVLDADLAESHGNEAELLPVPATYLINQEGIIIWRHFDPDYSERSKTSEIVEVIQGL